ncbi:MAG: AAC(3) family N-acetyltransferase [Gemmatimonadota bacterium]|nr:AAC(3) family N-acetyltransferase [Gemmatimonadota bacterium]
MGPAAEGLRPEELARQLLSLGVEPGGVLLVHTSFRALRPVDGGPGGVIVGLREALGPEGTLVMPSWSAERGPPFDPSRSESAPDLGVVASVFWKLPNVRRSDHPHAFAAIGPRATDVLRDPLPLPPHRPESPVGRVHELDGQVLLLGVDHDADTTIHLAEVVGGAPYRVPKQCTILRDGRPFVIEYGENDHCCRRFKAVDDWLEGAGAQTRGPVGRAIARLARSRDIVDVVVDRLASDPLVFLHEPDEGCADCDEARATVPAA